MDTCEPDDDRLSPQEVAAQLRAFTAADWAKARSLARLAAAGLIGWAGDDLLTEALTRLQDGKRVWRRGVHALVTLKTIMRSIANGEFKKLKNGPIDHQVVIEGDVPDELTEEQTRLAIATAEIDPVQAADSRNQLKYVEELVQDDEDCWLLVQLWAEGRRGQEAARELAWSDKHYDAVRKRLERRLHPLQELRKTA